MSRAGARYLHDVSHRSNVSVSEARALFAALLPEGPPEACRLARAYGRRLAADLVARVDHPSATESALDGVACRAEDTAGASPEAPVRLRAVGESRAGGPPSRAVGKGEAVRIYTGAPLPPGADAICPVEKLRDLGDAVELLAPARREDVRAEGGDFRAGDVVLRAGVTLTPARVALAAALGHAEVPVRRALRVALLSTGDEVVEPGRPLARGQVYNSNLYGLIGLVQAAGHEAVPLGTAPDSPEALALALERAGGADLLLTNGGVSMGKYDFVRDLLLEEGEVAFRRVRMRPGGPATCGRWRGLPLFGLPGNPVSALIVFEVIVRPALTGRSSRVVRLVAADAFPAVPDKTAFWRGVIEGREVRNYGRQGSGHLRSLADADALVVVPEGRPVHPGDEVEVMPWD